MTRVTDGRRRDVWDGNAPQHGSAVEVSGRPFTARLSHYQTSVVDTMRVTAAHTCWLAEVSQGMIMRPENRVEVGGAKCHSDYVAGLVKTIWLRHLLGCIGQHCQRLKRSVSENDCATKIERVRTGELCEKIAGVVEHLTCTDVSSNRHDTSRHHDLRHRAASPHSRPPRKRRERDTLAHHR